MPAAVSAVVEGDLDEAVLLSVADYIGFSVDTVYGRRGKPHLLATLEGYNSAARFSPWLVLVDLDRDYRCASTALQTWLPQRAAQMYCRVVVRAIEAWLLADRERLANWLGVSRQSISAQPDAVPDPMRYVVDLARGSSRKKIRNGVVPRPRSGRPVGPLYNSTMSEFVASGEWRIDVARQNSDSLQRAINRLQILAAN